ncbi:hypothetical protein GRAN_5158 [Granulicella sibirica]|uniref:Uncharacterized protein n=1 Tax=Granulicella sibirica TaxID=2479048 RepID=A0A4Q0SV55_9BACT|nr:hypothetical protein GRAN_5158 [Granulicella sibirica]
MSHKLLLLRCVGQSPSEPVAVNGAKNVSIKVQTCLIRTALL